MVERWDESDGMCLLVVGSSLPPEATSSTAEDGGSSLKCVFYWGVFFVLGWIWMCFSFFHSVLRGLTPLAQKFPFSTFVSFAPPAIIEMTLGFLCWPPYANVLIAPHGCNSDPCVLDCFLSFFDISFLIFFPYYFIVFSTILWHTLWYKIWLNLIMVSVKIP